MDNFVATAGMILGIGLISVLFGTFLTFDQLVRLEYNSYRAQWEKDGTPRGFFWLPREYWRSQDISWFGIWKAQYKSGWAMQKPQFWIFSTPLWIKNDERAKKLLMRLRILVLIWNGTFLLGFISIVLFGSSS